MKAPAHDDLRRKFEGIFEDLCIVARARGASLMPRQQHESAMTFAGTALKRCSHELDAVEQLQLHPQAARVPVDERDAIRMDWAKGLEASYQKVVLASLKTMTDEGAVFPPGCRSGLARSTGKQAFNICKSAVDAAFKLTEEFRAELPGVLLALIEEVPQGDA